MQTLQKQNTFSVLNDVNKNQINYQNHRNTGIELKYHRLSLGYGNWNQWWGPGIHNSLTLSNNSEGFYHYFVGNNKYIQLNKSISYKVRYLVSDKIKNELDANFYLSALFFNVRYDKIELGYSRNILSGGYPDIKWDISNAIWSMFTNKNLKYWDTINDYYLKLNLQESGLEIFVNIGFPNRQFNGKDEDVYSDHSMGSNLGFRKKGFFDNNNLEYGFEYTRLVQGIYYNIIPTSNWYDNIKYNYHSYNQRRWAAHSGSDSDDLLIYFGYGDSLKRLIFGLNYERHGVSYHFPPEVKIESKISFSHKYKNTIISIDYENEYFEHYAFVDKSINVWKETFEEGSIQRTKTILFSITSILN